MDFCTSVETNETGGERGFTLIEVAIAAIITVVGLIFLASLFTLAISQNKLIRQFTSTTMLAQQKLEELNAIEVAGTDDHPTPFNLGGDLNTATNGYFDYLDHNGAPTEVAGAVYRRYWRVENDPQLNNAVIVSVRVVAAQASQGRTAEETTLTTVRSW